MTEKVEPRAEVRSALSALHSGAIDAADLLRALEEWTEHDVKSLNDIILRFVRNAESDLPGAAETLTHDGSKRSAQGLREARARGESARFRVIRPHARGGLGEVFLAVDGELKREVALKELLEDRADDPAARPGSSARPRSMAGSNTPESFPFTAWADTTTAGLTMQCAT